MLLMSNWGGMDFSESHLRNLFEVSRVVYSNPSPADLCSLLATRVCPSGEIAKVYLGALNRDGVFRTVASFGYSVTSGVEAYEVPIESKRPISVAYRNSKVIITTPEDVSERFPDLVVSDPESPWSAIVAVPVYGGRYIFIFRLQSKMEESSLAQIYFATVGAILSLYKYEEHLIESGYVTHFRVRLEIKDAAKKQLLGKRLTNRQELILELIQNGKTNSDIAEQLRFSESLIRQETVVIYAKLGVSGRRELRSNSKELEFSSRSDDTHVI